MDSEPSFEESYQLFQIESNQLEDTIKNTLEKSDKTISDIIQIYYQVIKVTSLGKLLKQRFQDKVEPNHHTLLDRIDNVQKTIVEKFNMSLHPTILSQLTDSVQKHTDDLKSLAKESGEKSKESIEEEAKLYKELRDLMSTKEFVEQYAIGIEDD
ncbi:MAG: hypothetical protein QF559_03630 [Candidatus Nitrosopelagicus sp.]|nr:hypothetical protein [Candidatus Nitrosopelagicus sp.]